MHSRSRGRDAYYTSVLNEYMCLLINAERSRTVLELAGAPASALVGLLELLYPPATFRPGGFALTLESLAGVARLAAALDAPSALRHCEAARDHLGVVPKAWEAGYAREGDPRYLLKWLQVADAIPGKPA